jgi:hypothetical protein
MLKVRKLVDLTFDDELSKCITVPIPREKLKRESSKRLVDFCGWIYSNLKNELSGPTEKMFILTVKEGGLVGIYLIGMGTESRVAFRNIDVLNLALHDEANLIIAIHNHPKIGNIEISQTDIETLSECTQFYRSININYWMLICNKDMDNLTYYYSSEEKTKYKIKISTQNIQTENGGKLKVDKIKVNKYYDSFVINSIKISVKEIKKSIICKEQRTEQSKKTSKKCVAPKKLLKGRNKKT